MDEGYEAMCEEEQMDLVLGKDVNMDHPDDDDVALFEADGVEEEIDSHHAEEIHRMTMLALGLADNSEGQQCVDEFVEKTEPVTYGELQGAAGDGDSEVSGDDAGLGGLGAAASGKPGPKPRRASFGKGRGRGRGRGRGGQGRGQDTRPVARPLKRPCAAAGAEPVAQEPFQKVGEHDLAEMGLPKEIWPLRLGRGTSNYTLTGACGHRIEVQLKTQCFRVKTNEEGPVLINWRKHGGVAKAWVHASKGNFVSV